MRGHARPLPAALLVLFAPPASPTWNDPGHRVLATIADRRLDEASRRRVAEALRPHPAHDALWRGRDTNGEDEALNLFWNASVFPDDTRSEPWRRYGRPAAHYANLRILAAEGDRVDPPAWGEATLNSHAAHLRRVREARTPAEERAVHLSWAFQAGGIYQPLHAVSRSSTPLPGGDRGGNEVAVPKPRGRGENPHGYWDDLLGTDREPAAVARRADDLMAEDPAAGFAGDLARTEIRQWAEEGVEVALRVAHRDPDPEPPASPTCRSRTRRTPGGRPGGAGR